jgi:invasion protein IalB
VIQKATHYLVTAAVLAFAAGADAGITQNMHGSWTVRCEFPDEGDTHDCIMFQNLVLKTGGQPVLHFAVGIAPDDQTPTVIVSLPLGISLPPGITIQIDDGKKANFPVERCQPEGCRAGMKLREATIDQLTAGTQLTITFHDGERKPITVPLSLDGFAESFQALKEGNR